MSRLPDRRQVHDQDGNEDNHGRPVAHGPQSDTSLTGVASAAFHPHSAGAANATNSIKNAGVRSAHFQASYMPVPIEHKESIAL